MANTKGSSSIRNLLYPGRHALLPPKSPFPSMCPSYVDHLHNPNIGSKVVQKAREANVHHQRTSSENLLVEEQPSWLDDLLNEPDTPIRRGGHRRSSSDSFTYLNSINVSNLDYATQDDNRYKNRLSPPSWGSQEFNLHKDSRHALFSAEMNLAKQKNKPWDCLNDVNNPSGPASVKVNNVIYNPGSVYTPKEADGVASTTGEKQDIVESGSNDTRTYEKKDASNAKPSASDTDTKRAKQQFAQRSRVRKLQYISELERNVQALQAEGSEVSAELEFMNQQNLILNMENKALKQRLESLAQEQLIKYLEQEVLEREIGRLRALYQQQQQQQQPQASSSHRRTKSRDLDSQLANLSLKHKDASSGHDPITGPLRI